MPDTTLESKTTDQTLTQAERTARSESCMIEAAIALLNTAGIQGTTLVAIGINSQWLVSPDFDLAAAYEDFKRNLVRLLSAPSTEMEPNS